MEFTVSIGLYTAEPLKQDDISMVAAIGGAATANPGSQSLSTMLTVDAADAVEAARSAADRVANSLPYQSVAMAIEVLTTDAFDEREDANLSASRH